MKSEIRGRLSRVRRKMADANIDVLLVRSTDRYLNEYVPTEESSRVYISGFTGSMGEVAVTRDRAYLAVDGRYWLQAEKETDPSLYEVLRASLSVSIDETLAAKLAELARANPGKLKIGYPPDRISPQGLDFFRSRLGTKVVLKPIHPCLVEATREDGPFASGPSRLRILDETRVGQSAQEKLDALGERLTKLGADAMLIQRLDEIAYLTNLRGDEIPYQATFKSLALATRDRLYLGLDPLERSGRRAKGEASPSIAVAPIRAARPRLEIVSEPELFERIGKSTRLRRIAYDPAANTELARSAIEKRGATAIPVESPIGPMKAKKTPTELAAMMAAFQKADRVVDEASRWLCREVTLGRRVTEATFARQVEELFRASGAVGLSFRIISAAGKNGAIIHYSDPSPRRAVKAGELMLLDTGAYYEEGYATDLTRTFLVGSRTARGTEDQRRYYTLVLRAAIAGMTAVLPIGARGGQLDAITRAPLWAEGLNFNHGTGHGVGINVHEFPPRIGPNATAVLEEGFVFSIEPGVYLPSFGGIRIENLCTLDADPRLPGFMRVRPLTFSPLDRRLIDSKRLTESDRRFLAAYQRQDQAPEASPSERRRAPRH